MNGPALSGINELAYKLCLMMRPLRDSLPKEQRDYLRRHEIGLYYVDCRYFAGYITGEDMDRWYRGLFTRNLDGKVYIGQRQVGRRILE